jgi:hypothetical protein
LAEELLRRVLVPPTLDEKIQDMAVLVDSPPEIMTRTVAREQHLIHMPLIARPGPPTPECSRLRLAECAAPLADGLVGHEDPTSE